jgi:hypothetical protein
MFQVVVLGLKPVSYVGVRLAYSAAAKALYTHPA